MPQTSRLLITLLLVASFTFAADSAAVAATTEAGPAPTLNDAPAAGSSASQEPAPHTRLPGWLNLSGEIRSRFEAPLGTGYEPEKADRYVLSRLRLGISLAPTRWLQLFAQVQDSRVLEMNPPVRAATLHDPLDIRQAYLSLRSGEARGFSLRAGRQELSYAGGWLASASDWSNTTRVFDAAVASAYLPAAKLDLFAGSVVLPDFARLDRHKPGEHFYGSDLSLPHLIPMGTLEAFWMLKTEALVLSETGHKGMNHTHSGGFRVEGKLPYGVEYKSLLVRQFGQYSSDRLEAWGGAHSLRIPFATLPWKPALDFGYAHATGDAFKKDGVRNTFDSLYGGFHNFLGIADRMGWRNTLNRQTGLDFQPRTKWKINVDQRWLALASLGDDVYNTSGAKSTTTGKATSRCLGRELDMFWNYRLSRSQTLGAGVGHLFPGPYLKQRTAGYSYTFPYVMWTKKL